VFSFAPGWPRAFPPYRFPGASIGRASAFRAPKMRAGPLEERFFSALQDILCTRHAPAGMAGRGRASFSAARFLWQKILVYHSMTVHVFYNKAWVKIKNI
jgi:hypothetical protein